MDEDRDFDEEDYNRETYESGDGEFEVDLTRWPYAAPKPGTVFFAKSAIRAYGLGAGYPIGWYISDEHGSVAILDRLPEVEDFVEAEILPSLPGAGTPVVIAYNPATVVVRDARAF